jgi:hypothetical protein
MNERFAEEVEATLQRGVALPSPLIPEDGHPRRQLDTDPVAVDWRMPDGSVSLLESGLAACESILKNAGYDVRLADLGERILVTRSKAPPYPMHRLRCRRPPAIDLRGPKERSAPQN